MLEVLRQDYMRTARAKGLRERVVILKHGLRNALIPLITYPGSDPARPVCRGDHHRNDLFLAGHGPHAD